MRYITRLGAYLYLGVDEYPPFSGAADDSYPVRVEIAPPLERYSRVKVFFQIIYAILAIVIRYALGIVIAFVAFLSWFVIVVTGRQPATLQNALSFALSYTTRADAFVYLLTETYPHMGESNGATGQPTMSNAVWRPTLAQASCQESPAAGGARAHGSRDEGIGCASR